MVNTHSLGKYPETNLKDITYKDSSFSNVNSKRELDTPQTSQYIKNVNQRGASVVAQ